MEVHRGTRVQCADPTPTCGGRPGGAAPAKGLLGDCTWCYPAHAAAAARAVGVRSAHPYWENNYASVVVPQAALRTSDRWSHCTSALDGDTAAMIEEVIMTDFVGATLAGCIEIKKYLLAGGYGRGWEGELTHPHTGQVSKVFVKTLGTMTSDIDTADHRDLIEKIHVEAKVYTHEWFEAAVDQPGTAVVRLCRGRCINKKTGFDDDIFFVCGEYCGAGDLWAYYCHKKSFPEPSCRRIIGQLAHALAMMRHCGEGEGRRLSNSDRLLADATAGMDRVIQGCFHRDLKLENIIVNENFSCKLMDYGSLKFTNEAEAARDKHGKMRPVSHTPWQGTDVFKPPSFFYDSPRVVRRDGYDPAAWDVWSLGTILLYLSAGQDLFALTRKNVYRFFELTLGVRPKDFNAARMWEHDRKKVGSDCLFYEVNRDGEPTDKDPRGIPNVPRVACNQTAVATAANPTGAVGAHCPEEGVPTNHKLWAFLGTIDPDRPGGAAPRAISPELKDLLNRMLDVDPETRISMDDICDHPWLRSHQSSSLRGYVPDAAIETDEERATYTAEMAARYSTYVNSNSSTIYLNVDLTIDKIEDMAKAYCETQAQLVAKQIPPATSAAKPTVDIFRSKSESGSPLHTDGKTATLPIFRLEVKGSGANQFVRVVWVRNPTVVRPNGDLVNCGATLAEWHHFTETMKEFTAHPDDLRPSSVGSAASPLPATPPAAGSPSAGGAAAAAPAADGRGALAGWVPGWLSSLVRTLSKIRE